MSCANCHVVNARTNDTMCRVCTQNRRRPLNKRACVTCEANTKDGFMCQRCAHTYDKIPGKDDYDTPCDVDLNRLTSRQYQTNWNLVPKVYSLLAQY